MMYQSLLVIFLLVAVALVILIMLQQGKGTDVGSSFSTGASGTLFGSIGASNFMTRMTAMLATLFLILSLMLGNMSRNHVQQDHVQQDSEWNKLNP